MVSGDEIRGVHMSQVYPFIITVREAFPFDQVLELLRFTITLMTYDSFDLLFFFAIDQVRGWPGEVRSVIAGFLVWR